MGRGLENSWKRQTCQSRSGLRVLHTEALPALEGLRHQKEHQEISKKVLLEPRTLWRPSSGPRVPSLDSTPSSGWSQVPKGDSENFKKGTPKWGP